MISVLRARHPFTRHTAQAAAFVRFVAFLLAAASVVVIPSALAAAAAHHMPTPTAFAAAGVATCLTLIATIVARSLDPLR